MAPSAILSLPRRTQEFYAAANAGTQRLEIVYVSSDSNQQEFEGARHSQPWLAIPYADEAARTALKRRYGVCAMREAAALGVAPRKAGIPSLVVVNKAGDVVEFDGVKAAFVGNMGVVGTWMQNL